ncbi:MAG: DUF1343 domain-containing protein [Myxococcales bacterium]|nr:DUF1343 domain-containing protein [Myxococcales bacterium]
MRSEISTGEVFLASSLSLLDEFVGDIPAIDLLTGSAQFRKKIDNTSMEDLLKLSETPQEFADRISGYLLY